MNYDLLPEHIRDGMKRYIEEGVQPRDFLTAVIQNNLVKSFQYTDDTNIKRMKDIVTFMYWEAPSLCWSSKEKMDIWINHKGFSGYISL